MRKKKEGKAREDRRRQSTQFSLLNEMARSLEMLVRLTIKRVAGFIRTVLIEVKPVPASKADGRYLTPRLAS